jgi:hypothetical protein
MKKIIFLYDELMTLRERRLNKMNMKLLSYAQTHGKLYWFNDGKKKRIFAMPVKGASTKIIYGALFETQNYEFIKHKLNSYYYNASAFIGENTENDLYVLTNTIAYPIKFDSLSGLQKQQYTKGNPVECEIFIGNLQNKLIKKNHTKYHKLSGVDVDSFVTLIKENKGE